ncbi:hypothetical protein FSARC_14827 [Fusarium sarcochroum]|uniref:Uncharacterized protein n=1 Tax=Fusarium sarcochroum TaxID=1208366 RepID=A0A8H4WMC5_9HYPO|nr:hypothetical protein FSARC_14827 [Fusarium sarcochroum]
MVSPLHESFQLGDHGSKSGGSTLDYGLDLPDYCSPPSQWSLGTPRQTINPLSEAQEPESTSSEYEPVLDTIPTCGSFGPNVSVEKKMEEMSRELGTLKDTVLWMRGCERPTTLKMQRLDPYQATGGMSQEPSGDGLLLRRCRDRLAAHIEIRTGVKVEPAEVSLTTKQSHAYTWTYTTEVAHLFSKDLDDHQAEAYQKLCREVGRSFHAVSFTKSDLAGSHLRSGSPPPFCVPTCDVDATEVGEVTERASLLSH